MKRLYIALLLLMPTVGICGDLEQRVNELVNLQGFEGQIRDSQTVCLKSIGTIDMTERYRVDPSRFGGIGPDSSSWQEAKMAYADFLSAVCLEPTAKTQVEVLGSTYLSGLNPAEVQAAIEFYKSPAGRQFVKASKQANVRLANLQNSDYSTSFLAAFDRYQRALKALQKDKENKR